MSDKQLQDLVDWLAVSLGADRLAARATFNEKTPLGRSASKWAGQIDFTKTGAVIQIRASLSGMATVAIVAHELAHHRQWIAGVREFGAFGNETHPTEIEARCVEALTVSALFGGPLGDFNDLQYPSLELSP